MRRCQNIDTGNVRTGTGGSAVTSPKPGAKARATQALDRLHDVAFKAQRHRRGFQPMGAAEKQVIAKYLTQPLEGLADGNTLVVALCGALAGFLFWIGYFRPAAGHGERHVHDAQSAALLRLWAYGHIPLYLGIGALGAGTVYLSHHTEAHGAAPWIYAMGVALGMAGVTLISFARSATGFAISWRFVPLILITALLPAVIHNAPTLVILIVLLSLAQLVISLWPAHLVRAA